MKSQEAKRALVPNMDVAWLPASQVWAHGLLPQPRALHSGPMAWSLGSPLRWEMRHCLLQEEQGLVSECAPVQDALWQFPP